MPHHTFLLHRLLPAALLFAVTASTGCAKKEPVRLEISKIIPFKKRGDVRQIKIAAYDKKDRPFVVEHPPLSVTNSDESVVKVETDAESLSAKLTAVGSGTATITARMFGLEATLDITQSIPAKVEIVSKPPKKLRMLKSKHQLKVKVFDDKGKEIKNPKVMYSTSDYCITVTPDGLIEAVSVGKCAVIARAGEAEAVFNFEVK